MCVEQCIFSMSSVAFLGPQNAPKSLAGLGLAGFKGHISKAPTSKGREEREREGREEGRQNELCRRAPETLAPPLVTTVIEVRENDIYHSNSHPAQRFHSPISLFPFLRRPNNPIQSFN